MKKRILSAIIMSALVLSLTACGASTDAPEATEGAEVTTTTAVAEGEKTEAETEENLSKIEGKETEISEEAKAEEALKNLSYNASGVVFGENSASSGMLLNMQI